MSAVRDCLFNLFAATLLIGGRSYSSNIRLMWVVYSEEVRGEVGTRPGMCCVGWVVWVHGYCYCMLLWVNIVGSMVSFYVNRGYMYMYT